MSLFEQLAKAQAEFPAVGKGKIGNVEAKSGAKFSYAYADLADVFEAVRPVLAKHGIAHVQRTVVDEYGHRLVTSLHYGDESIASECELDYAGLTAQQVGSLRTYMRRYEYCALVGVHPAGEDDDGAAVTTAGPRQQQRSERRSVPAGAASEKQQAYLGRLLGELVAEPQHDAFIACVLDGEVPQVLTAAHCNRLIDALVAAKKGTWPANWTHLGAVPADRSEPFDVVSR